MAMRGLRAVHGARVRLFHGPLGLGDAAPRGRPLARHVLFAGDLAQGECAVNEGRDAGTENTKWANGCKYAVMRDCALFVVTKAIALGIRTLHRVAYQR